MIKDPSTERRTSVPPHAMLGWIPIGVLVASTLFDLASHTGRGTGAGAPSLWLLWIALGSGLLASLTGLLEMRRVPVGSSGRRTAILHLLATDVGLVAVAGSAVMRWNQPGYLAVPVGAIVVALVGTALVVFGAVLGGRLVYGEAIGVRQPTVPDPRPDQNSG